MESQGWPLHIALYAIKVGWKQKSRLTRYVSTGFDLIPDSLLQKHANHDEYWFKYRSISIESVSAVLVYGAHRSAHARPGCTTSQGDLIWLYLPFPGSWFPNPSSILFQSGLNVSISRFSPRGIHISSTTRYRHLKFSRFKLFAWSIDFECSFNRFQRTSPGSESSPQPPFLDPGGTASPT